MAQPLSEIFEKCQRRFPTVQISIDVFQARVEEILASEMGAASEAKLHYEDLFLAIACARDDRVAWEYFSDDCVPLLKSFAAQACGNSSEGEELAQEITAKLLKEKDRLASYNGRGSLAAWLRVTVSHAAVDRFRRRSRTVSLDSFAEKDAEALCRLPDEHQDEERLDSRWGPVVSSIAGEHLRALPARDRLLLSLYYLQGVPLRDLGRQFGVHEATASRWLDRLRGDTRKEIERTLRKKHGMRSSEIQSLWRWVSPSTLAASIAGNHTEVKAASCEHGPQTRKKAATDEKSGVINKEEEVR